MEDTLTLDQYSDLLQRLYGVVSAYETWLAHHVPPAWHTWLSGRYRLPFLEADLRSLNAPIPITSGPSMENFHSANRLLGAIYVMEGSTLGGQIIARHLEQKLHLTLANGLSFLGARADRTGPLWKQFLQQLEPVSPEDEAEVIAAAQAMFRVFGQWVQP